MGVSWGGGASGAAGGAQMGAMFGPVGMGIGAIGGGIAGLFKGGGEGRSDEEKEAIKKLFENADSQTDLARLLGDVSKSQFDMSQPAFGKALDYYSSLLGGGPAAIGEALAPDVQNITELARGAERSLESSNMRGGAMDQAKSDLERDKFNQIAGLAAKLRPGAADQLGKLGLEGTGQGITGLSASGGVMGNVGNQLGGFLGAEGARSAKRSEGQQGMWSKLAGVVSPFLNKAGGANLPSSGINTNNIGLIPSPPSSGLLPSRNPIGGVNY